MRKREIALSVFTPAGTGDRDVSYWLMAGTLSDDAAADVRLQRFDVTVFDPIDATNGDDVLSAIAMATLHTADWQQLKVTR